MTLSTIKEKYFLPARESGLFISLLMAVGIAVFWWLLTVLVIRPADLVPIWFEQKVVFTRVGENVLHPYDTPRYINPPWPAFFLMPFTLPSLPVAVLIQQCLYFTLLTLVIYKYGGTRTGVLLTLTSFIAMDNAFELSIDWLAIIGLLLPPAFSGIFLMTKPHLASGVVLSYTRWQFIQFVIVSGVFLLLTLVIWGFWPADMRDNIEQYLYAYQETNPYSIAPASLIPPVLSYAIGLGIATYAFKKRDPVYSIISGLFFVPYILFYSLLLHFALVAVRLPLLAKIIYICLWVIYGGGAIYVWLFAS